MPQSFIFVPMQEDGINAILHLLKNAIDQTRREKESGKKEREMHLLSTLRNDLQGARRGVERIRTLGYPVTDVKEWTIIGQALLALGTPESQELLAKINLWLESCTYNPAAPQEQAHRNLVKSKIREGVSLGRFPVDEIIPLIQMVERKKDGHKVDLLGHKVNVNSKRLQTFKLHGLRCAVCGLEGQYFSLEYFKGDNQGKEHPHLNLYGVEDDKPILMTHDHIIPLSAGGADSLQNMRTMCFPCNMTKGSRLDAGLPKKDGNGSEQSEI